MNEISPNKKLVPLLSSAAAPKVTSSTGTSAKEWEVSVSTRTMMTMAMAKMMFISPARVSAWESPTLLSMYTS